MKSAVLEHDVTAITSNSSLPPFPSPPSPLFKDPNPRRGAVHRAFSKLNLLDRKRREARRARCTYTGRARLPRFGNFSRGKKVTQRLSHWHNFLVVQPAHAHDTATPKLFTARKWRYIVGKSFLTTVSFITFRLSWKPLKTFKSATLPRRWSARSPRGWDYHVEI